MFEKVAKVSPVGGGSSPDGTMIWHVFGLTGVKSEKLKPLEGTYEMTILLWDGKQHQLAHKDLINFPAK